MSFRIKTAAGRIALLLAVLLLALSLSSCRFFDYIGGLWDESGTIQVDFERDEGSLAVFYLDVGQGDCEFVELPDGTCMLIDTGLESEAGRVIRLVKSQGYDRIDHLVLTHPHGDHMGGAARILKRLDVGRIYMPRVPEDQTPTADFYYDFVVAASGRGYRLTRGESGVTVIDTPELSVTMFAPVKEYYDELNNYSIGIKIVYRDVSFLFFGDGEELAERDVLDSGFDVSADVYKVSHHGSSTSNSPEFLDAVSPSYAVISCGRDNPYGHPHRETLDAFKSRGIEYYRTDRDGSVIVQTDGSGIEFITEKRR